MSTKALIYLAAWIVLVLCIPAAIGIGRWAVRRKRMYVGRKGLSREPEVEEFEKHYYQ